jgi:hypothetical protein
VCIEILKRKDKVRIREIVKVEQLGETIQEGRLRW